MTDQYTASGEQDELAASVATAFSPPGFAPVTDPYVQPDLEDRLMGENEDQRTTTLYFLIGGTIVILLFIALTGFLYWLGGPDESALERLQSIAVIYIVFLSVGIVILLAAATIAFVYLTLQLRDKALPAMDELTETLKRVRGTTEFMTEEAVKPVIKISGKVAQAGAMYRVIRSAGKRP